MISSKRNSLSRSRTDRRLALFLAVLTAASALIILLIVGFLGMEAWPVLGGGNWLKFFSDDGWYPLENQFGLLPMLWATLVAGAGAILLAAPLGLGCAIFEKFYATKALAKAYRLLMALLAGIPSVVYGLWGLTVIVPLLAQWQPPGASLLAAILILGLMILPTVAVTSAAALSAVPNSYFHGAASLGLSRPGTIVGVAIPAARGGIIGGILLAVARALGETMAVLMVAGNVVQTPHSVFDSVRVLTANIALEMAYAVDQHRAGLFASGLLLTLLVLLLAWLAHRAQYHDYA